MYNFKVNDWIYCQTHGRGVIINIKDGLLQVQFYSGVIEYLSPSQIELV